MTLPKTLAKFATDPRLDDLYSETDDGGERSYWAATKTGYMFPSTECHTLHEYNVRDMVRELRTIIPCACDDCKRTIARRVLSLLITP